MFTYISKGAYVYLYIPDQSSYRRDLFDNILYSLLYSLLVPM